MTISGIVSRIRKEYYIKKFNLTIGNGTFLPKYVDISSEGKICIGDNCILSNWICLREYGGFIKIGNNCSVNSFCHISGNGGIRIGDNVRIATQCVLISANHNFVSLDTPIFLQGENKQEIVIEDDCWLGAGVKVLAGVTIGKGSVIGAGAVINKDIPPYSVVVGVPGRVIRTRGKQVEVDRPCLQK